MFKDRNQELERLSQELLEENDWEEEDWEDEEDPEYEEEEYEEEWDEDFDDEAFDHAPEHLTDIRVRAYNTDHTDTDLDELSDEVYYAPKSRLTGALIVAGISAMAVCLALVLLLLRHYGVI